MNLWERAHFLHRAWRHLLHSDKQGLRFLRGRELWGRAVIDVGANRGVYSYWMHRKVGPEGQVFAFEPQPELAEYLTGIRRAFRLSQLEIVNCGISSSPGSLQLVRPPDHWGGASFEVPPQDGLDTLDVSVTSLDEFFHDHPARPISFIKCDVEGHESHVFLGAESLLKNDRPEILVEVGDPEDPSCQTFRVLESYGYTGYCFQTDGYIPVSRYNDVKETLPIKANYNFAFIPNELTTHMPLSRAA